MCCCLFALMLGSIFVVLVLFKLSACCCAVFCCWCLGCLWGFGLLRICVVFCCVCAFLLGLCRYHSVVAIAFVLYGAFWLSVRLSVLMPGFVSISFVCFLFYVC